MANNKELTHRLFFEITSNGYFNFALIEQYFLKSVPSRIIVSTSEKVADRLTDVEDFSKPVKKAIINSVLKATLKIKELNKQRKNKKDKKHLKEIAKLNKIKGEFPTTLILPIELVKNEFFKHKIKNNYIKNSAINEEIDKNIQYPEENHPIIYERKEIVQANDIFKLENRPKKFHRATIYALYSSIDKGLYKFLKNALYSSSFVGEIFMYSEIKAIRKSFAFYGLQGKRKPHGEILVDWRDNYVIYESSTNTGYSKSKIVSGYQKMLENIREQFPGIRKQDFDEEIINHHFHVKNDMDVNMELVGGEDKYELKTTGESLWLTNYEIQNRIEKGIEKSLEEINLLSGKKEVIHFGKVNEFNDFDKYLHELNIKNKTSNHEFNFNFEKLYDKPGSTSKNIMLFALNEKNDYIQTNGEAILSAEQQKNIDEFNTLRNFVGKIFVN